MTLTNRDVANTIFKLLSRLDNLGVALVRVDGVTIDQLSELACITKELEDLGFDRVKAASAEG